MSIESIDSNLQVYCPKKWTRKSKDRSIEIEILLGFPSDRWTIYVDNEHFKKFKDDEIQFTADYYEIHKTELEYWLENNNCCQCIGFKKSGERCRANVAHSHSLQTYRKKRKLCFLHGAQIVRFSKIGGWDIADKMKYSDVKDRADDCPSVLFRV